MEDVYRHMRVVQPDDPRETDGGVPARLSPQFSLAFLRQASDPALLLTRDGRVSFLNAAACALFGLEKVEQAQGRQIWELWPDPEAAPVLEHATGSAAAGDAVRFPAVSETDGAVRQWHVILSPVVDTEGTVASIFFLAQDA